MKQNQIPETERDDRPSVAPPETGAAPADVWARVVSLATLEAAWEKVRRNAGAAGGDGVDCARFARDAPDRLLRLRRALLAGEYAPGPVRRAEIPKPNGETRPLDIPCVVDRVAQTAACLVLTPLLEPLFEETSYGYRPGRSVKQAVQEAARLRDAGFGWVVEADIERFFERTPHDPLMATLERTIGAGPLSALIGLWLESARPTGMGLPQGAPISPLLANLYLDAVDETLTGRGVRLIRFGDDFRRDLVILSRGEGSEERAAAHAAALLGERGLTLKAAGEAEGKAAGARLRPVESLAASLGRRLVAPLWGETESDPDARLSAAIARREGGAAEIGADMGADMGADVGADAGADNPVPTGKGLSTLYLTDPGRRLGLRTGAATVLAADAVADRGGPTLWREILAVPLDRLDRVELWPGVAAEADTLRRLAGLGVAVSLVGADGTVAAEVAAPSAAGGCVQAQARLRYDPAARLDLARRLLDGRMRNQRALLRRLNQKRKTPTVAQSLDALNRAIKGLAGAADMAALCDGAVRAEAAYRPALKSLVQPVGATAGGRRDAPAAGPADAFDAALILLEGLLAREIRVLMGRAGLHPAFGVGVWGDAAGAAGAADGSRAAHGSPGAATEPGVCDLTAEFRAPLVEGLAVYLFNNRALTPAHVWADEEGRRLTREGAAAAIRGYERWVERPIKSPRSGRRVAWRGLIAEQAQALARHMEGSAPYAPYVMDY